MAETTFPDLPAFRVVPPNKELKADDLRMPDGTAMIGPDGFLVPPARSMSMVVNAATRIYSYRFDEAMRDNFINARAMRRDNYIRALLEERILPTINRKWQLEIDNDQDPEQVRVRDGLAKIVSGIPDMDMLKRALLDGVWFGRAGAAWTYGKNPEINNMWGISRWDPVHGDSMQFTYDGVPAILMDSMTAGWYSMHGAKWGIGGDLATTDRGGTALVLHRPYWRDRYAVHVHMREKADYFEGELAGSVQGLGLRGLIYWQYVIRTDALTWMLAYMQAVGQMDLLVFNYPQGNVDAQRTQEMNAQKVIGKAAIACPRNPNQNWPAIEQISMNDAGLKVLHDLIANYFDRHIERLIVGQSMSSGSDHHSGLGGTGRADFAKATKDEILVYDTNRLDETMSRDLIRCLKHYNYPDAHFPVRFRSVLPDLDARDKVQNGKILIDSGVPIVVDEWRNAAGFKRPKAGEEIIGAQPPAPAMPPGGPAPAGMPPMNSPISGPMNVGSPPSPPESGVPILPTPLAAMRQQSPLMLDAAGGGAPGGSGGPGASGPNGPSGSFVRPYYPGGSNTILPRRDRYPEIEVTRRTGYADDEPEPNTTQAPSTAPPVSPPQPELNPPPGPPPASPGAPAPSGPPVPRITVAGNPPPTATPPVFTPSSGNLTGIALRQWQERTAQLQERVRRNSLPPEQRARLDAIDRAAHIEHIRRWGELPEQYADGDNPIPPESTPPNPPPPPPPPKSAADLMGALRGGSRPTAGTPQQRVNRLRSAVRRVQQNVPSTQQTPQYPPPHPGGYPMGYADDQPEPTPPPPSPPPPPSKPPTPPTSVAPRPEYVPHPDDQYEPAGQPSPPTPQSPKITVAGQPPTPPSIPQQPHDPYRELKRKNPRLLTPDERIRLNTISGISRIAARLAADMNPVDGIGPEGGGIPLSVEQATGVIAELVERAETSGLQILHHLEKTGVLSPEIVNLVHDHMIRSFNQSRETAGMAGPEWDWIMYAPPDMARHQMMAARRHAAGTGPAPTRRRWFNPRTQRSEFGLRYNRQRSPTPYVVIHRHEGEVWRGPSGHWFTLRSGHVTPTDPPDREPKTPGSEPGKPPAPPMPGAGRMDEPGGLGGGQPPPPGAPPSAGGGLPPMSGAPPGPMAPPTPPPEPPPIVPPDAPIMRGLVIIPPRTLTNGVWTMIYPADPGYDKWLEWIANNRSLTFFQSGADPLTPPYPGRGS